jgi:hypothetical protein
MDECVWMHWGSVRQDLYMPDLGITISWCFFKKQKKTIIWKLHHIKWYHCLLALPIVKRLFIPMLGRYIIFDISLSKDGYIFYLCIH